MRIGVPKEIKVHEYRVGLVPAAVRELVEAGHEALVETEAGGGIGFSDADYRAAGAQICSSAEDAFAADLIVKVKEPQPQECLRLQRDQVLFTYLHLAPDPDQAQALCKSGVTAIAYETVTAADGARFGSLAWYVKRSVRIRRSTGVTSIETVTSSNVARFGTRAR